MDLCSNMNECLLLLIGLLDSDSLGLCWGLLDSEISWPSVLIVLVLGPELSVELFSALVIAAPSPAILVWAAPSKKLPRWVAMFVALLV